MATIQSLFNVEAQVEAAITAELVAKLLPAVATISASVPTLDVPRVEVEATVTGDGPHEVKVGSVYIYDQMTVSITVRLLTASEAGQASSLFRGYLRAAMLNLADFNAGLTDWVIAADSWRTTGGSRTVDTEQGLEEVVINYSAQVYIKPASLPASIEIVIAP